MTSKLPKRLSAAGSLVNDLEFLNLVLDKGEIAPDLLTADKDLQDRIRRHPLLEWKAVNVKAYKKTLSILIPKGSKYKDGRSISAEDY